MFYPKLNLSHYLKQLGVVVIGMTDHGEMLEHMQNKRVGMLRLLPNKFVCLASVGAQ